VKQFIEQLRHRKTNSIIQQQIDTQEDQELLKLMERWQLNEVSEIGEEQEEDPTKL